MNIKIPLCNTAFLLTLCSTLSSGALAQTVIYDSTPNARNQTLSFGNEVEYGDEIVFDGTARVLTSFSFEYLSTGAASGNETAQLFLRNNDGPTVTRPDGTAVSAPGTVLYTSEIVNISEGGGSIEFSGLSLDVPDRVTWSVMFSGLDTGEDAGLRISYPATIGESAPYFWQKTAAVWELRSTAIGFSASATAVPEPATIALFLAGGLMLIVGRR